MKCINNLYNIAIGLKKEFISNTTRSSRFVGLSYLSLGCIILDGLMWLNNGL